MHFMQKNLSSTTLGQATGPSSLVSHLSHATGDRGLWLLHGATSIGVYLVHFTYSLDTCPFCGQRRHVYFKCARLHPLYHLLRIFLLSFWLQFSPHLFFYALHICGLSKSQDLLVNLLLAPSTRTGRRARLRGTWATVRPVSLSFLAGVTLGCITRLLIYV